MSDVLAVVCSDLHMRTVPPLSRSEEPDWYAAMARPFAELSAACETHNAPLLVAGDLFHVWHSSVQLVNWAVAHLPKVVYAVPGQHDLPGHRTDEIHRSAYWTLASTRRIRHIDNHETVEIKSAGRKSRTLRVTGFGWGAEVAYSAGGPSLGVVDVALIHAHVYSGSGHIGVDPACDIVGWKAKLNGYDVAVFGDNHQDFETRVGNCTVMNCGGLLAVNSNERLRRPGYGLLLSDGSVVRKRFDTSADVWSTAAENPNRIETGHMSRELIQSLAGLAAKAQNYPQALRMFLCRNKQPEGVSQLILKTLDKIGESRGD